MLRDLSVERWRDTRSLTLDIIRKTLGITKVRSNSSLISLLAFVRPQQLPTAVFKARLQSSPQYKRSTAKFLFFYIRFLGQKQ